MLIDTHASFLVSSSQRCSTCQMLWGKTFSVTGLIIRYVCIVASAYVHVAQSVCSDCGLLPCVNCTVLLGHNTQHWANRGWEKQEIFSVFDLHSYLLCKHTVEGCVFVLNMKTSSVTLGVCSHVFNIGLGLVLLPICNLHQPALPPAWDLLSFQTQENSRKVSILHTPLLCTM